MARERRTIAVMRDLSAAARDCPLAPPEHASVHSRALHRACLICGGIDALADQVGVSAESLRAWMQGEGLPPDSVFLACVEIILLFASGAGRPS